VQNEGRIAERVACTSGVVMVTSIFSRVSYILEDGLFKPEDFLTSLILSSSKQLLLIILI